MYVGLTLIVLMELWMYEPQLRLGEFLQKMETMLFFVSGFLQLEMLVSLLVHERPFILSSSSFGFLCLFSFRGNKSVHLTISSELMLIKIEL